MKNSYKILIVILCAAIALGIGYVVLQKNIFPGKWNLGLVKTLKITKIKAEYGTNENIVVSGQAKNNYEVAFFWNHKIGMTNADSNGAWTVNFGQMPAGKYPLEVIANDSPTSRIITTAEILVAGKPVDVSLINKLSNYLAASLSQENIPGELVTVPESAPEALSGNWKLLK